jgi:Bacterial Ig-like domain
MRRRTVAVAIVAVGMLGATSPSAVAAVGSYQVDACNQAPEGGNNSWGWTTTDPSQPAHFAEHANCPYRLGGSGGTSDQEGGLSTTDTLGLSSGAPPGTSAGWTFTAPSDTTITALTYERYIGHQLDPFNDWSPALRADGNIVPGETCLDSVENGETCSIGGPPGQGGGSGVFSGLAVHDLTIGVLCGAPAEEVCVTGASQHEVWAAMYGATVTVADSTPPTLNAPSGALWSSGEAGGFHKGMESVTISAQDVGGGVQSIVLAADDQPVASYRASCNFTFAQPCPTSTEAQTLTLPTTGLPDGTHTLAVVATDAAGNQSALASEQVTVDNNAPAAPVGLAATPTRTGSPTFTATWSDPAGQVAPITGATYQLCPASGAACGVATAAPAAGPAPVSVPGLGSWNLAVWLSDAAGNGTPANAAHAVLTVAPSKPGGSNGGGTTGNATIRVSESLSGRELVVHVRGSGSGKVRVSFTGRLGGKTVAWGVRTVLLKHRKLSAMFKLGPRTAAHALIRVTARLGHQAAVTSTLHRAATRHGT